MDSNLRQLLLPFYFGSVSEEERLKIERELLTDSEILVDYLDLKRQVEAASLTQMAPSKRLWEKVRPKTAGERVAWISISIGAALAAGLALALIVKNSEKRDDLTQPSANRILFDSSSELPASSSVL